MLKTTLSLRVVSRRLPASNSLHYSSFSKVNHAPAATAVATAQLDETPYSHWNAVGNEPVTAERITALLANNLSNLGVRNFLSSEERARMVQVIRTHTIVSMTFPMKNFWKLT
jgi:hypothetical protein